jgi:hypothetical protein
MLRQVHFFEQNISIQTKTMPIWDGSILKSESYNSQNKYFKNFNP